MLLLSVFHPASVELSPNKPSPQCFQAPALTAELKHQLRRQVPGKRCLCLAGLSLFLLVRHTCLGHTLLRSCPCSCLCSCPHSCPSAAQDQDGAAQLVKTGTNSSVWLSSSRLEMCHQAKREGRKWLIVLQHDHVCKRPRGSKIPIC